MRYQENASADASELVIRADLSPKSLLTLLSGKGLLLGRIVSLIEMTIRNYTKLSKRGQRELFLTLQLLKTSATHTHRHKL